MDVIIIIVEFNNNSDISVGKRKAVTINSHFKITIIKQQIIVYFTFEIQCKYLKSEYEVKLTKFSGGKSATNKVKIL